MQVPIVEGLGQNLISKHFHKLSNIYLFSHWLIDCPLLSPQGSQIYCIQVFLHPSLNNLYPHYIDSHFLCRDQSSKILFPCLFLLNQLISFSSVEDFHT